MPKSVTYYIKGIHCASCQIIIERRLNANKNIHNAHVSKKENKVEIFYTNKKPTASFLNKLFKKENYKFSLEKQEQQDKPKEMITGLLLAILLFGLFLLLGKSGVTSFLNVDEKSGLLAFFILGILAGLSTCSALVGGIILSLGKQWQKFYGKNSSVTSRMQPHLLFNLGRIGSYLLGGVIVGMIGGVLQLSSSFSLILSILISLVMVILGLQMLGVKWASNFSIAFTKVWGSYLSDEKNFKGKLMPVLMGAGTILLPCGFTITSISMAALSGDPMRGGLIMLAFSLGTLPSLMAIGFTSVMSEKKSSLGSLLSRTIGALILLFATYNINSAMNALALPSLSNLRLFNNSSVVASAEDEVQVIKMTASARGYNPNYFTVKAGVPVRWEIEDVGTSGCSNAIIAQALFDGEIALTPGTTSIKEFTPKEPGKYKFSCWMGMITGMIEVVDSDKKLSVNAKSTNEKTIETDETGCGGGCQGSCGGSCGNPSCEYR